MVKNKYLAVIAAASLLSFALPTLAYKNYQTGPYVGGQLGYGQTEYGFSKSSDVDENGLAGRVYAGYQFNPYLGLEMGGSIFSDVDLPHGASLSTTQLDVLAKIGTPFGDSNLRGDIKGGIAAIRTEYEAARYSLRHDFDNTEIKAIVGASLTANVTRQLAVDVSYLHGFGDPDKDKHAAPRTDLLTLGMSYQFCY
jgi:opacity protein-like surface antigen